MPEVRALRLFHLRAMIYTKKGDKGKTGLFDGRRVSKNSPVIAAIGSLDEANSFLGIIGGFEGVQANLMRNNTVWDAMAKAFESKTGDLAARMMAALEAAQKEGGDIRGMQSAAMVVVSGKPTGMPWRDRLIDIRVDDSPQPLVELRRLLDISHAYDLMNKGDELTAVGKLDDAAKAYGDASRLAPGNLEVQFWNGGSGDKQAD